jgi:hypothetical protein
MTPREIEGVLDRWFADGPRELSDRALGAALSEIDHTRQLGAHVVPWRYSEMPTPLRLLLVAALMVASAGAAVLLTSGMRNNEITPMPSPSPSAPAKLGPGAVIGAVSNGDWEAQRPAVFGFPAGRVNLAVPLTDGHLFASVEDGPEIHLGQIIAVGNDRTILAPTDTCPTEGRYAHRVGNDGLQFTIIEETDDCDDRAALLAGTWDHTWIDRYVAADERYRIQANGATVDVTVPASFTSAAGGKPTFSGPANPNWEAMFKTGDWAFAIHSGGNTASDRCHIAAGTRKEPSTIEEYLAWSRSSRGLEVDGPVQLTIDGLQAIQVDMRGNDQCQADDIDSIPPTYIVEGMEVREWVIDVGDRLLVAFITDENPMVALTPPVIAAGEDFVGSMEITPAP